MIHSLWRSAIIFVSAWVIWLLAAAAHADEEAAIAARLDALAEAFMATEQVPGAIAVVVSGDTVILRGYGLSDIDSRIAVGPDNVRFEIGSITKVFTWIAVMMLVEEGWLDLDADVEQYLEIVKVPGSEPLTLAHLMSHRGGFEETYAVFDEAVAALPRAEALIAATPDQVFPRGTITSYSNWGAALAGNIVEEVSGQAWEDFVQVRILDPLGMDDTTTAERLRRQDQPPLALSYRVQGGVAHPAFRFDLGAFGPAGGTGSTAADMARFLKFLMGDGALDGVRLLQPETMALMRTRLFDDRALAADMAHGLQSWPMLGTTVYGHAGGLNEFLSNLVFIPEIGAGVFISQNGGSGAHLPFEVPDMILGALAAKAGLVPAMPQPVPDAAARAAEASGRYLTSRRTFSGPGQLMAVLAPLTVTALPDGALLIPTLISQGPVRHEPVAPDIWQDP
jgi:CubicO group peptidase (beta-lactamase class C family)